MYAGAAFSLRVLHDHFTDVKSVIDSDYPELGTEIVYGINRGEGMRYFSGNYAEATIDIV